MKKYQIIYADPCWQFKNKKTGGSMKSGSASQYDVMSIEDLCKLKVQDIADENCVLIMWWVGSMPKEAIQLVEAWGFTLKTMTGFVWVKTTITNILHFGMGHWTRASSESCIIATKGKPKRVSASVRSVFFAPVGEHSAKPKCMYKKIVELCGDVPRIELFARTKQENWSSWGNEVESDIEL